MKNFYRNKTLLIIGVFLIIYFSPILYNPFIPLNIVELLFMLIISAISFIVSYKIHTNNRLTIKLKNNISSIIILIFAALVFFHPISFPANFNIFVPRIIALIILLALILIIIKYAKNFNIDYWLIAVIFIPIVLQAIFMSFTSTIIYYILYPNITSYLTIALAVIYFVYKNNKK